MYMHFSSPHGLEGVVTGLLGALASWKGLRSSRKVAANPRFTFQLANARTVLSSFGRSQCASADAPRTWAVLPNGI